MNLNITIKENEVTMPASSLEHIANCLANQQYIGQWNADATEDIAGSKRVDKEMQEAIDKCWQQLMATVGMGDDKAEEPVTVQV